MSKKKTVTTEVIIKTKELLKSGHSQHETARRVGVSQFSVNNIHKGYYDSGKLERPKQFDPYDYSFF